MVTAIALWEPDDPEWINYSHGGCNSLTSLLARRGLKDTVGELIGGGAPHYVIPVSDSNCAWEVGCNSTGALHILALPNQTPYSWWLQPLLGQAIAYNKINYTHILHHCQLEALPLELVPRRSLGTRGMGDSL